MLTRQQAAEQAGVSVRTIDRWAARGLLPRYKNMLGFVYYKTEDLETIIAVEAGPVV